MPLSKGNVSWWAPPECTYTRMRRKTRESTIYVLCSSLHIVPSGPYNGRSEFLARTRPSLTFNRSVDPASKVGEFDCTLGVCARGGAHGTYIPSFSPMGSNEGGKSFYLPNISKGSARGRKIIPHLGLASCLCQLYRECTAPVVEQRVLPAALSHCGFP